MSRIALRKAQQDIVVLSRAETLPVIQGTGLVELRELHNTPGRVIDDNLRYVFSVPTGTVIRRIRTPEAVLDATIDAIAPTLIPNLGVTFQRYDRNFPYLLGRTIQDRTQEELIIVPDYKNFKTRLIPTPTISITAKSISLDPDAKKWSDMRTDARVIGATRDSTGALRLNLFVVERFNIATAAGPQEPAFDLVPFIPRNFQGIPYPTSDYRYFTLGALEVWSDLSDAVFTETDIPEAPETVANPSRWSKASSGPGGRPAVDYGLFLSYPVRNRLSDRWSAQPSGTTVRSSFRADRGIVTPPLDDEATGKIIGAWRAQYYVNAGGGAEYFFQFRTGPTEAMIKKKVTVNQYQGGVERASTSLTIPVVERDPSESGTVVMEYPVHTPEGIDSIGIEADDFNLLEKVIVGLPRQFSDRSSELYLWRGPRRRGKVWFFARGPEIRFPSNATVVNPDSPDRYLSFSGDWNQGSFTQAHIRDPAWILFWVLTDEMFGIETPEGQIDFESFYQASVYNNELLDGKPRWAWDGVLEGTGRDIVRNLTQCMHAALVTDWLGRLVLQQERPGPSKWIICPATTAAGEIRYRFSLPAQPRHGRFLDRNTGEMKEVERTTTSRVQNVPWQDERQTRNWLRWENWRLQQLLDTVEFSLPWSYQRIQAGDVVSVYDPEVAGVRTAGRIVTAANDWIQMDSVPLEIWPDEVAAATLREPTGRAYLDPELWGYTTFRPTTDGLPFASVWIQRFTDVGEGSEQAIPITRVAWLPGGRPEQNRVWLATPFTDLPPDGTPWGLVRAKVWPSYWRVQSVSEEQDGTMFRIVATRHIPGMHAHVEKGTALRVRPHRWLPTLGVKLSQFQGPFDELNDRYPKPSAGPFDDPGTFDNLVDSRQM